MADPAVPFPLQHRMQPIPWDLEAAFAPQITRVAYPTGDPGPAVQAAAAAPGNLAARFSHVIAPRSGLIRDFNYWVAASSGNAIGMIYDVGQADPTLYTKLWDSGSVAVGAANAWQTLGNPGLRVMRGTHLMFGIVFDNATAAYGRGVAFALAASSRLPASFLPDGGAADRRLTGAVTLGSFAAPANITLASMAANGHTVMAIARMADS
jgi:hypothetical protein